MTQTATPVPLATLDDLVQQARGDDPIRVAVVDKQAARQCFTRLTGLFNTLNDAA